MSQVHTWQFVLAQPEPHEELPGIVDNSLGVGIGAEPELDEEHQDSAAPLPNEEPEAAQEKHWHRDQEDLSKDRYFVEECPKPPATFGRGSHLFEKIQEKRRGVEEDNPYAPFVSAEDFQMAAAITNGHWTVQFERSWYKLEKVSHLSSKSNKQSAHW